MCNSHAQHYLQHKPFWQVVERLEFCGLKVMALVCDGLAANRKLFRLHGDEKNRLVNKVKNPSGNQQIFFPCTLRYRFSDFLFL